MEGKLLKQLEHIIDSEFSINLAKAGELSDGDRKWRATVFAKDYKVRIAKLLEKKQAQFSSRNQKNGSEIFD